MAEAGSLTLARIERAHAAEMWALHNFARRRAPHGFLAVRKREELEGIVTGDVPGVAVGAYVNNRLVGYSLSRRLSEDKPLTAAMRFQDENAYMGLGTAILPEWTGRILMARLLRLRGAYEIEAGGAHVVGLIDVRNLASVANALRAGAVLVGSLRDATSLNWVAYSGRWFDQGVTRSGRAFAALHDIELQGRLFSRDWGAVGLQARPDRRLLFARLPDALRGLGLDGWTLPE